MTNWRRLRWRGNRERNGYFLTHARRAAGPAVAVWTLAAGTLLIGVATLTRAARAENPPLQPESAGATWRFAVSGDSRNCGDVVMPAIAAGVNKQHVDFYWHLGDFRWLAHVDEDLRHGPEHLRDETDRTRYQSMAWDDFIKHQAEAFGTVPVFLGIGNHETTLEKNRQGFIEKFRNWFDQPAIRDQRLQDDPTDQDARTYYHWVLGGVDFITLDNASQDEFSDEQVEWFEKVLARDAADASISTIVAGMHAALPDSISFGHSMSNWPQGVTSGRRVYEDLWNVQTIAHKHVYVLASHSHFWMDGIFKTNHWREKVLDGWIVGTAGAMRYPLPQNWQDANRAMTNVYGYLLATVNPDRRRDGTIKFQFRRLRPSDVPRATAQRFDAGFVNWCFQQNTLCGNSDPHCDSAAGH